MYQIYKLMHLKSFLLIFSVLTILLCFVGFPNKPFHISSSNDSSYEQQTYMVDWLALIINIGIATGAGILGSLIYAMKLRSRAI